MIIYIEEGINTLLISGVNTNSCVLATTTAANVRDYVVDHVCIGTDAPFDMADNDPMATIDAVPGMTPLERQCVCCGTALKLL